MRWRPRSRSPRTSRPTRRSEPWSRSVPACRQRCHGVAGLATAWAALLANSIGELEARSDLFDDWQVLLPRGAAHTEHEGCVAANGEVLPRPIDGRSRGVASGDELQCHSLLSGEEDLGAGEAVVTVGGELLLGHVRDLRRG